MGIDGRRRDASGSRRRDRVVDRDRAGRRQRQGKRGIRCRAPDGGRAWLVHRPRIGRADHRVAVARRTPHDAQARLEVRVVLLMDLVDVHADAQQRRAGRVEDHELVVALGRRDVPLVPQSDLDGEVGSEDHAVLREKSHGALVDVVRPLAKRDAERIGVSGQKRRHARKVERPRPLVHVLVQKVAVLPPNFMKCRPRK